MGGGHVVADRGGGLLGWVPWMTGYRDHPRFALEHHVDPGAVGVWALAPKGGDHGVDDVRVVSADIVLAQTHPLHGAGAQVVQHHIGARRQPCQRGP